MIVNYCATSFKSSIVNHQSAIFTGEIIDGRRSRRGRSPSHRANRIYPEIYFQPGPQGDRETVLLPGARISFRGHRPVGPDALAPGLARCPHSFAGSAFSQRRARRRDDAGILSLTHDVARHADGFLCAHHRAAERIRQLRSSHPAWRRGHGLPHAQHAFVLDDLHRLRRSSLHLLHYGRSADIGLDRLCAIERRRAVGRAG